MPNLGMPLPKPIVALRSGNEKAGGTQKQRAVPDQTANRWRGFHFKSFTYILLANRLGLFFFRQPVGPARDIAAELRPAFLCPAE